MTTHQSLLLTHTCGQCTHAKLSDSRNLSQRLCKGSPPTAIALPGPGQSIMIKGFFPPVQASDEACGSFKPHPVQQQLNPNREQSTRQYIDPLANLANFPPQVRYIAYPSR